MPFLVLLCLFGILSCGYAQSCDLIDDNDCWGCISAGCTLCMTESTRLLYFNDFETKNNLDNTGQNGGYPPLDFQLVNTQWGGQGELQVSFTQHETVEGLWNQWSDFTQDPETDQEDYGVFSIGMLRSDLLGMFFEIYDPYIVIMWDTSGIDPTASGTSWANGNAPSFTLSACGGTGTNGDVDMGVSCCGNAADVLDPAVTVEGVAGAYGKSFKWGNVAAALDVSAIPINTAGSRWVTICVNPNTPTYMSMDNLKIFSSSASVEIPRIQSCAASADVCPEGTTSTAAVIDDCPCDLLSNDCRDDQCFSSTGCGWCADECCDDFTPGATLSCPSCGDPSSTGYDFASGGSLYQDTRDVTCAYGYGGADSVVTCQSNALWSTPENACVFGECGTPDPLPGLSFAGSGIAIGDVRTVTCAEGYLNISPDSDITCGEDLFWTQHTTTCEPVDCGEPEFAEAYYTFVVGATTFGNSLLVFCAEGFEGLVFALITCQSSGAWTEPSVADPEAIIDEVLTAVEWVAWLELPDVVEAVQDVTESLTEEQIENVFDLLDTNHNGQLLQEEISIWTALGEHVPTRVNCNAPSVSELHVLDDGGTLYEDTRSISCVYGYNTTSSSMTCQADGSWTVVAACVQTDCGVPTQPGYSFSGEGSFVDDVWTVDSCADLFAGEPIESSISCALNGQWTRASGCVA
jgi:hypothetical protein